MSPKRKDRVAPPAVTGEWDLRCHGNDAIDGWEALCNQAPGPTRAAWEALTKNPRDRTNPSRQCQLRFDLAAREIGGKRLEQWQYEVTGAGRVWYCIDDETCTVWITLASTGHPSKTDR